jgi:hypothetical protein
MAFTHQSEMGLSLMRQCPKATHSLPTPPSSPQLLSKGVKRQTSRFRLPKILRRTQTLESIITTANRKVLHNTFSSLEDQEYSKQDNIGTTFCRPIPVTEQAVAFPSPVVQSRTSKQESLTRNTSGKLRKMPKSCRDLKAHTYDKQPSSQPQKLLPKTPRLLPSPLHWDDVGSQNYNVRFAFQNSKELRQAIVAEPSYEYQGIIAGYCEDVFQESSRGSECTSTGRSHQTQSLVTPPQRQEITHTSGIVQTPPTSNMSATLRSPKRDRSSSLSSEAMWLSKSFAYQDPLASAGQLEKIKMNEKRLAEKSRRCCQLVQGPTDDLGVPWLGERKAVSYPEACRQRLIANHVLALC